MLHTFQQACVRSIPYSGVHEEPAPGRELLTMICDANSWFGSTPNIYSSIEEKTVYILYRGVVFPVTDFWDAFALPMAIIGRSWPISAFGTAENHETVRLFAQLKEHSVELLEQSISGKGSDTLHTLCLQVDCPDSETAQKLYRVFTAVNWRIDIAAADWRDADFLQEQKLMLKSVNRGMFCYACLDPEASTDECLLSLSFGQKISLWLAFLKERLEPLEFEWLSEKIAKKKLDSRMEWELALREAISQLDFRLVNMEKSFELFDNTGKKLYFSVDCQRPAERSLLKILFPLNY